MNQAFFVARGTSNNLKVRLSPQYANIRRGIWALSILSVTIHKTNTAPDVYLDCIVGCDAILGQYYTNRGLLDCNVPLASLNLDTKHNPIYHNPIGYWHIFNNIQSDQIKFSIQKDMSGSDVDVPHDFSIYFSVRKMS